MLILPVINVIISYEVSRNLDNIQKLFIYMTKSTKNKKVKYCDDQCTRMRADNFEYVYVFIIIIGINIYIYKDFVHDKNYYGCDQCKYKAITIGSLKTHRIAELITLVILVNIKQHRKKH